MQAPRHPRGVSFLGPDFASADFLTFVVGHRLSYRVIVDNLLNIHINCRSSQPGTEVAPTGWARRRTCAITFRGSKHENQNAGATVLIGRRPGPLRRGASSGGHPDRDGLRERLADVR